ncbi:uncharacterized protein LOC113304044 isoform X1 [Papaver somniferum]|uniref:uncharacterized protein LOC113304044 isoform X1 n=1 Tax=Papaver somniferum TaxID=3469 RepID=UPI000E6FB78D|nr:uncharacterized protein LOC113304044 isoform X1 [Papaver somniferum]
MLKGPYIAGSNVLPANLATYQPWVFNWPEKEKEIEKLKSSYNRTGKANTLSSLRSITDEVIVEREEYAKVAKTKGKGKCALRKEKSTAPSSKKRKVRSPSPSNSHSDESSDDDDDDDNSFANKDSLPESSMTQLFSIFSDSMQAIGDDHLTNTCKALANICDAPLLDGDDSLCRVSRSVTPSFLNSLGILTGKASFAVASDLEKRRRALEKKNLQLRKRNEELEA